MSGDESASRAQEPLLRCAITPAWWSDRKYPFIQHAIAGALAALTAGWHADQAAAPYWRPRLPLFGYPGFNNRMGRIKSKTPGSHQHQGDHDGDRGEKRGGTGNISHDHILFNSQIVTETFGARRGSALVSKCFSCTKHVMHLRSAMTPRRPEHAATGQGESLSTPLPAPVPEPPQWRRARG